MPGHLAAEDPWILDRLDPQVEEHPKERREAHRILNLILSHNSVSGHFCKQHGNLYMTVKSIFENSNLFENAFLIWHRTH